MSDLFAKRLLYDSINLGTEYRPRLRHHKYGFEVIILCLVSGWVSGIFMGYILLNW